VSAQVRVRDDGSDPAHREAIGQAGREAGAAVHWGENLGPLRSFWWQLQHAPADGAPVAFCDQDDVWLPGKLARAAALLAAHAEEPAMYCGRARLVDANLRPIGLSPLPRRAVGFANALVENVAIGCTVVLNARARALLLRAMPTKALMHDWWAYLVLSALGRVVYDPEVHVLYRQHGANVTGMPRGWRLWRRRVYQLVQRGRRCPLTEQAFEFREIYGALLPRKQQAVLDRFLDGRRTPVQRLRYAVQPDVYRHAPLDQAILRALLAAGRV
jgi:hypothetical protein